MKTMNQMGFFLAESRLLLGSEEIKVRGIHPPPVQVRVHTIRKVDGLP